jgi:hypothetical protein
MRAECHADADLHDRAERPRTQVSPAREAVEEPAPHAVASAGSSSAQHVRNGRHRHEESHGSIGQRVEAVSRVELLRGVIPGVNNHCPGSDLGGLKECSIQGIDEQVPSNAATAVITIDRQPPEERARYLPVPGQFLPYRIRERLADYGKRG